jgi:GWxTD domain-containing protein
MTAEWIGAVVAGSFGWITAAAVLLAVALRLGEGLAAGTRYWMTLGAAVAGPVGYWTTAGEGGVGGGFVPGWWGTVGVGWIWGVGVLSLRTAGGWVYLQVLIRRAAPVEWPEMERLAARMGVARRVEVRLSGRGDSPFTARWRRPVIVLPLAVVTGLPAAQLEAVLLHELAHVRRWDYLFEWVLQGLETVCFYHPAMWWMTWMARQERERSCDEMAIATGTDRAEYARALIGMEELRAPAGAAAWTGGGLRSRVERIVGQRRRTTVWPVVVLAVLGLSGQVASPWMKWVEEDVVYIIRAEEKRAYLALKTDEERGQFVKQFWARRDPTPGTEKNEFKEEHYRRIAWVGDRIGYGEWRSEKGKTYIVYGPPDEIESHPSKGYEQWLYRYLEGRGRNVIFTFGKK